MCGHVGLAGDLAFKDEATIKRLLLFDYFRGTDSTGLATISKNGEDAAIAKIASHPIDFFDTGKFKAILSGARAGVFMGHNRAATKGAVNGNNAHPFQYDHIVGCHNGTLSAASWSALEEACGEKTDVDSQAIFLAISKLGIERTMSLMTGAWALVWFDLKEGTLNFLRNDERPFWTAFSKDFKKLFWASEWPMIQAALDLAQVPDKMHEEPKTGYIYFELQADLHVKYYLSDLLVGGLKKPKPVVKPRKGKEAPVVVKPPFRNLLGGTTTSTTYSTGTKTTLNNVVNLFGTNTNPFAGYIGSARFDDIAKYGCSWCGAAVDYDEVGVSVLDDEDMILCPKCSLGDSASSRVYVGDLKKVS